MQHAAAEVSNRQTEPTKQSRLCAYNSSLWGEAGSAPCFLPLSFLRSFRRSDPLGTSSRARADDSPATETTRRPAWRKEGVNIDLQAIPRMGRQSQCLMPPSALPSAAPFPRTHWGDTRDMRLYTNSPSLGFSWIVLDSRRPLLQRLSRRDCRFVESTLL
ncbi:hypothetical protein LZ31DRAFT_177189 [Colletotrichum somersetense]|nr:hypothetical protein LZ31DRAFT_177189 [Colletotrichum somersetense]